MAETSNKWMKMLSGAAKFLPIEAPWVAIVVELVTQMASALGATSGDSKEALRQVEGLRGEMAQMAAAHAALAGRLDEQTAKVNTQVTALNLHTKALEALNDELNAAHTTAEGLRTRMEKLERRATLLSGLGIVLLVVVCALSIALVVHLRR